MTIVAPAARRSLFVDWAFFDGSEISSEFVGGQCASWRFPPKATVSACSRHSFIEGIRNGGLDVTQNRRSTRKIHFGRTKLPALQRFFLSPSCGAGSLGLFGLFLCECLLIAKVIPPNPGFPAEYGTAYDTDRSSSSAHRGFHALPTVHCQGRGFGLHLQLYGGGGRS